MKIAVLSTYPPLKCGIAYYTRNLINGLVERTDFDIVVLSNGKDARISKKVEVIRSWEMDRVSSFFRVIHNINKLKPNLVHIQFHPGLYGTPSFSTIFMLSIMTYLKLSKKKMIVTFHTLPIINKLKCCSSFRMMVKRIIKLFVFLSNRVIVHTENQKELLTNVYNIDVGKINVVPIGITKLDGTKFEELDKFTTQNQLNNKFVILSCPFLRFGLELEYVMGAIARCSGEDILFVINGSPPAVIEKDTRYLNKLQGLKQKLGLDGKVKFITDYNVWRKTRLLWRQAANLTVYSHSDYPSEDASMSLGEALGLYRPLIVFDVPKFRDIAAALRRSSFGELVVPNIEAEEKKVYIYNTIEKVRNNYQNYKDKIKKVLEEFVEERTWDSVAYKMVKLYKEVFNGKIS